MTKQYDETNSSGGQNFAAQAVNQNLRDAKERARKKDKKKKRIGDPSYVKGQVRTKENWHVGGNAESMSGARDKDPKEKAKNCFSDTGSC